MRPQYQLPQGSAPEGDTCLPSGVTAGQRPARLLHTFLEGSQEVLMLAVRLGERLINAA